MSCSQVRPSQDWSLGDQRGGCVRGARFIDGLSVAVLRTGARSLFTSRRGASASRLTYLFGLLAGTSRGCVVTGQGVCFGEGVQADGQPPAGTDLSPKPDGGFGAPAGRSRTAHR